MRSSIFDLAISASLLAFLLSGCAASSLPPPPAKQMANKAVFKPMATASSMGIAAYRSQDFETAWTMLYPLADTNDYRAKRYLAFMLLAGQSPLDLTPREQARKATAYLLDGARLGDNNALIVLQKMRASNAPHAPRDWEIFEIEHRRAAKGDTMTAWRLAERYQTGDGVEPDMGEEIRWLKTVATDRDYIYSDEAEYRLCEIYSTSNLQPDVRNLSMNRDIVNHSLKKARKWCTRAADHGHSAAAITLARLKEFE